MWFQTLIVLAVPVLAVVSLFTKGKPGWLMALTALLLIGVDRLLLG